MQTRFRLQAPLGIGPDGAVHRAVADRLGARPVALRRLPIPAGTARSVLRRDAETVATLGHPALAVVDDIVDVDDRHVLVASTLGTRGTLADRLLLGPLPVDEAVALARTVAEAVDSAHEVGLTHGRITASNVALTEAGPAVCDLVQSAALGRPGDVAADTRDAIRLAASLVAADDRTPRAAAYRALCRDAAAAGVGLDGFVRALRRIDGTARDDRPPPTVPVTPPIPVGNVVDDGSVGLVVAVSLAFGVLVGAIGTVLPAVR
ncbi:hypothetical protein [Actinospongicola halichondriae]|uniref:hypothetical protein n=1 Tax=Actinospongicola halichondriae TaxID=3236844 RepID=UPI003D58CCCD